MEYVLVGLVVLLLVAGFITFMVLNATKRGGQAEPADPGAGAEGNPAGVVSPDASPLGDTTEHSGDQQEGHTVGDPEHPGSSEGERERPRVGDPGPEATAPESERLADRPR